jgi:hypothetical protein
MVLFACQSSGFLCEALLRLGVRLCLRMGLSLSLPPRLRMKHAGIQRARHVEFSWDIAKCFVHSILLLNGHEKGEVMKENRKSGIDQEAVHPYLRMRRRLELALAGLLVVGLLLFGVGGFMAIGVAEKEASQSPHQHFSTGESSQFHGRRALQGNASPLRQPAFLAGIVLMFASMVPLCVLSIYAKCPECSQWSRYPVFLPIDKRLCSRCGKTLPKHPGH